MRIKPKLSYTQIIAVGFLLVILTGSVLLSLPVASKTNMPTPFMDSLFTATSATCVTGLVIYDTYTHWSMFGQIVILCLIQIGGIGFMTIITMFSIFLKRQISLHERRLLMQSAGTMRVSGVVKLMKKILLGTLIFEGLGAVILSVRFSFMMSPTEAIYNGIFHSVSAFCNAGFDLMGKYGQFSSLTTFFNDITVNVTIMLLIITGGIGFIVWDDILAHKLKFNKYELHSKIVICATLILIFFGALMFYIFEYNSAFSGMTVGEKILASFFQSVTPRTAGFNTVDYANLSESGNLLTVIYMFIGGSPGSTAGGIKTTTLVVIVLGAISASRHTDSMTIFKKRLDDDALKQACAIFFIYIIAVVSASMIITTNDAITIKEAIFETVSAMGTVGLSIGIIPKLGVFSRIILILLMYAGRVGGLTLMISLAERKTRVKILRPTKKILIG